MWQDGGHTRFVGRMLWPYMGRRNKQIHTIFRKGKMIISRGNSKDFADSVFWGLELIFAPVGIGGALFQELFGENETSEIRKRKRNFPLPLLALKAEYFRQSGTGHTSLPGLG